MDPFLLLPSLELSGVVTHQEAFLFEAMNAAWKISVARIGYPHKYFFCVYHMEIIIL
jgi:hypothetical protein